MNDDVKKGVLLGLAIAGSQGSAWAETAYRDLQKTWQPLDIDWAVEARREVIAIWERGEGVVK